METSHMFVTQGDYYRSTIEIKKRKLGLSERRCFSGIKVLSNAAVLTPVFREMSAFLFIVSLQQPASKEMDAGSSR